MNPHSDDFIALSRNKIKFPLFLFSKLPSAFFSGVRVREIDRQHSIVTVPYKWFSKNPFHSTYFACQAMAAEMSSGLLALLNTYKRDPTVSILVTKVEGEFFKKAVGITSFVCNEGMLVAEAIESAISNNEVSTIRVKATGTNGKGELISVFYITWSFKARVIEPRSF